MGTVARRRTSGLPLELSSFVGRRREVDEVRRLLSASRLVTLTGPGGVGKTRLALEVSRIVHRAFPDGVVLVELDELRDAELVANAVALAVGMREAGRTSLEMLIDYLSSRRLLLVLDNSEHLVDAVAGLSHALLQTCHELRILSTSRECLGIAGEAVMPVPPLTLPALERPLGEQELNGSEAVTLFAERAASVRLGFTVNSANGDVVAEICQRLDGLPLAIELAAARVRALSEKDILARLLDRPQSLTAGQRLLPARQQTLRSCIEWSHGLCSDAEKLLWARLSVFAGGFELDAAEDVCSGAGLAVEEVLSTVASLLDKSVLVADQHGDVMRYRMLETIREFGVEQLDRTGEHADLLRRHRDFHLGLIDQANADWVSSRQVFWFARLDREHANVQAAVDYCLKEPGELEAAFRMLSGLFHFYWWGRGWAREGRLWLGRALDRPSPPSVERARALLTDGSLAAADGQFDDSLRRLADARTIEAVVNDPAITAFACWVEGSVDLYSGDLPAAISVFERGIAVLAPGVDVPRRLDLMVSYSSAVGLAGDVARATACHEEWLRITEPAGECFHRSYALWSMGIFAMAQGDHDRAAGLYRESIRLRRDIRDLTGIGWSVESLSWVEAALGHVEPAATLLGAADRVWEIMARPLRTYQHMYPYHEETERVGRKRLGDKGFDEAFGRGRSMTIDEAMAYSLGEEPEAAAPVEPPSVLTRREREIAGLIAEGLTSREIADRLVISVRTAETHTENILTKLGFKSRVQVATWVAAQRQ
ncbi:non-specific serine/threonine protein kinase [Lentzea atacamensis]|uniref:Non-specific serine/threonine protein kinase n=1 Tax=Lentzea atacamensis TaxID=531938 RepID=A0A316I4D5_9PSEU|nr:LuxR C-terminal-related transcriptional regulator [Lentzea atacamensis]PWK87277.1 non-specific serine/threonine protein kinase [Lentzea atacamensis]